MRCKLWVLGWCSCLGWCSRFVFVMFVSERVGSWSGRWRGHSGAYGRTLKTHRHSSRPDSSIFRLIFRLFPAAPKTFHLRVYGNSQRRSSLRAAGLTFSFECRGLCKRKLRKATYVPYLASATSHRAQLWLVLPHVINVRIGPWEQGKRKTSPGKVKL